MEEKDFRPGDPVTYVNHGNSVHRATVIDQPTNSRVEIDDGGVDRCVNPRNLYHGHNVQVQIIGEEKPKRTVKRYVNLFLDYKNEVSASIMYHRSIKDAYDDAKTQEERCNMSYVRKAVEIEIPEDMA